MFAINEGSWDRWIRVAVGLGILSLTVVGPHTLWGLAGLVLVVTGVAGFCPIYRLFGMSTCQASRGPTRAAAQGKG